MSVGLFVGRDWWFIAADDDVSGAADGSAHDGAQLEDSANELSQKLEQLKALLDAKGDGADPELKAKLAGLQGQLSALGLGDLGLGNSDSSLPDSKELTEFLTGCVMMSMKRLGESRQSTLAALRLLTRNKLTPSEASEMDMWRLTATCINELTEQELQQFKSGKLKKIPASYVELSKKAEAGKQVVDLEENIWTQLRTISLAIVGSPEDQPQQPFYLGLVAAIPLLAAFAFLGKKFMDMQTEKSKPKQKKREGKKSK